VDVKRDFGARRRHLRERRHADRHVIADPMRFYDCPVRMFRQQRSSKMRDHRVYCTVCVGTAALGCPAGKARKLSVCGTNKAILFLPFPQEVSPLHSFYTTEPHFAVALIFPLPHSACSQSARCSESVLTRVQRCRWFSRVNHRGKFGACPVCRCPGFAASTEIPLPRRMETPNPNPEAQASGEHRRIALFGVQLRDDLSLRRKMALRTFAITMRLGWLARAAFVF